MDPSSWFDDLPVIGKLPPSKAAAKLREVEDSKSASAPESLDGAPESGASAYGKDFAWPFQNQPWQHTAHAFGYLAPASASSGPRPIDHVGNIAADGALKNRRVRITLDGLRVAGYPGFGDHRILFDFYAQNQLPGQVEHLHFNATYRVREGERAAILGYPVFVGLSVGLTGVAFKCYTVNVRNDADERFLEFLDADVFKAGLKLATTFQPAIAPLSGMALGLTRSVAARHRNVPVQEFYLGLDFTQIGTGARLAEGSYIAVQIPEKLRTVWDWSDWEFNPNNGQVVGKSDPSKLIPYNYLTFGVTRYPPV